MSSIDGNFDQNLSSGNSSEAVSARRVRVTRPPRAGLVNRIKSRSDKRLSLSLARRAGKAVDSSGSSENSTSRASLLYASGSGETNNVQIETKQHRLARDYESILKKVWDPVPGIRLVVDGGAVMKELEKAANKDSEFTDNEIFWESKQNKSLYPVLCNYLAVWKKRRAGKAVPKSLSTTRLASNSEEKKLTLASRPEPKQKFSRTTDIPAHSSPQRVSSDKRNDSDHLSAKKVSAAQVETMEDQQPTNNESGNHVDDRADAADNEENIDEDTVIKVVTQTIGEDAIELAVLDADPNIGVRARSKGYEDTTKLIKEEDMLGILLKNGISEDKLATMELDEIIEKLISFVHVQLDRATHRIKVGFEEENTDCSPLKTETPENTLMPSVSSLTFENIETGHAKSVEDILAFDQGQHLASCSMDKTAHLWACDATKQHSNFAIRSKKVLFGHTDVVMSIATCGKWICTGSRDSTVRIWNMDVEDGEALVVEGHDDVIRAVKIFERKAEIYVVSGSRDKTIKVWNIKIGENRKATACTLRHTWEGHTKPVVALSHFVASYDCIVSASNDKTLRLWNINGTHESMVLKGHEKAVSCVQVGKLSKSSGNDDWVIFSGSSDRTVRVWALDTGSCLHVIKPFKKAVIKLSVLSNASTKAACLALSSDGRLSLIDLTQLKVVSDDLIGKENKQILSGATIRSVTTTGNDSDISCFLGLRDGKICTARITLGQDVADVPLPKSKIPNPIDNNDSSAVTTNVYISWDEAVESMSREIFGGDSTRAVPELPGDDQFVHIKESMLGNLRKKSVIMYNSKKNTWIEAIIWRENCSGSFDLYVKATNDRKINVAPSRIRISSKIRFVNNDNSDDVISGNHDGASFPEYEVGTKVLSRYKNGWEYYGATIKNIDQRNGEVEVVYDDGDEETLNTKYLKQYKDDYSDHDLVEVKYKGGKKWYRGMIEKFESSGKYVIKYCLDGEIERNVKRKSIWYVGKEQEEKDNEISYEVGDAILCRHNRGVRYFSGKIEKILPGGDKFDVVYDDGDKEQAVERWLFRKP